ncbi:MAG: hypothetical protein H0T92_03580 [Pyrinomonadaceae bacterium]|nr:hypothetical protein [Pyrinomonadaceae bacterium]
MAGKPSDNPDKTSAAAAKDTHKLRLVAAEQPSRRPLLPARAAAELRQLIRALQERQSSRRPKSADRSPSAACVAGQAQGTRSIA